MRVGVGRVLGEAVDGPYPVHEGRWNGVLRDRLDALTRETHAFAKKGETWDGLVILCLLEHNWLRPHRALREGGRACRGAVVSVADAGDGHRGDRSYLGRGGILDLPASPIPEGVTTELLLLRYYQPPRG